MNALYDPAEHRPLTGCGWDEPAVRGAIAEIASDVVGAYRGPTRLWPNHPADLEDGEEDRPLRCVYFGAAGVAWALHRLAGDGLGPEFAGLVELAATLDSDYRDAPEFIELETGTPPPPPSLLFGECGILVALEAVAAARAGADSAPRRDRLAARIWANARNPARELCWGSPGTMLAALAMWRATGEPRWADLWRDGAAWLLSQWTDDVWTQDLYGAQCRFLGAGHGFAGNAYALLSGGELLEELAGAQAAVARISETVKGSVSDSGDVAQWPPFADQAALRRPLQWCHGAPGMVASLVSLPSDPATDRLLIAGGELTWRAGPLRKGVGLCHGTAGNAFALLALYRRFGDERWLHRARAFAVDALADVAVRRDRLGRGRYTLFTGDIGVALLAAACLSGDAALPFLGGVLSSPRDASSPRPARAGRRT